MFIEKRFIRFINNKSNILIDAPHAKSPNKELYTDEITEAVSVRNKFNCIISKVSRTTEADLNRSLNFPLPLQKEARNEYISTLRELYESSNKNLPYLHIAIHGMKNRESKDIEIGTIFGKICDSEIEEWFYQNLVKWFNNKGIDLKIVRNKDFYGHPSLKELKFDDNYNIIQIEISKNLRQFHKDLIIDSLSEILQLFTDSLLS